MSSDPIERALREIAKTKHLLEVVIISSESFDYHSAKAALSDLKEKMRNLGKFQAELSAQRSETPNVIVPFPTLERPGI